MIDDQFGCHSDNVEAIFLQALASMISWEHGPRAIRACEKSVRGPREGSVEAIQTSDGSNLTK